MLMCKLTRASMGFCVYGLPAGVVLCKEESKGKWVGPRVISTRGPRNLNNLATWGTIPMPIPFPVSYSKLCILAVNGKLLSTDIICPKCQVVGRLFFTSSWVLRGIIWYGKYGILIFEKDQNPSGDLPWV